MSAQLVPKLLKRLEGSTQSLGGMSVVFEASPNHLPAARRGGEGYAIPVCDAHTGERLFLKAHTLISEERAQRSRFLVAARLHELHEAFLAAPFMVVDDTIGLGANDQAEIRGHLARCAPGKSLQELLADHWAPPREVRVRLALQLCHAVMIMEAGGIAHGDLAQSNVTIDGSDVEGARLRLIDFDGFHHRGAPSVPCSSRQGGRGFGQLGYRHSVYKAMDEQVLVTSDRAAMAALAFELVVLESDDTTSLGRSTALEQNDIDAGEAQVPAPLAKRWPEGARLLRAAFSGAHPDSAPGPQAWCEAIARLALDTYPQPEGTPHAAMPTIEEATLPVVRLRIVEDDRFEQRVNLRADANTFAPVSARLAWLSYRKSPAGIRLEGTTSIPSFLVRGGRLTRQVGQISLEIGTGDQFRWEDFVFEVV